MAYTPYGLPAGRTGTATTPFAYAGQYTDAETGFQWLRARYYDPATANFLSIDPLEVLTRQGYGYAGGNPITNVDPLGLSWWSSAYSSMEEHAGGLSTAFAVAALVITFTPLAPLAVGLEAISIGLGALSVYHDIKECDLVGATLGAVGVMTGTGGLAAKAAGKIISRGGAAAAAKLARLKQSENRLKAVGWSSDYVDKSRKWAPPQKKSGCRC
jgi:RHS repeat-associated protein